MRNLMIMAGLMLVGTATYAQRGDNATPEARAQRQTDRLTKELSLDAVQQKQVYALELTRVQKMQEMHQAQNQSRAARQNARTANDTYQQNLKQVLNDEQETKLQAMQAEQRDKRQNSRMTPDSTQAQPAKRSRGPR